MHIVSVALMRAVDAPEAATARAVARRWPRALTAVRRDVGHVTVASVGAARVELVVFSAGRIDDADLTAADRELTASGAIGWHHLPTADTAVW